MPTGPGSGPDPERCRAAGDVGQLHYDAITDTWYECVHDLRHDRYTWAILPPGEDSSE